MTDTRQPAPATLPATGLPLRQRLMGGAARQKLLAFASLLALMVFFSLASPNFLQADNLVAILQATAVNGVLAIACTFVIITSRHRPVGGHADDLLRGDGRRVLHLPGACRSGPALPQRCSSAR